MKTQETLYIRCKMDGTPMSVTLDRQNGGACFSINDDDNTQEKQILLNKSETLRLFHAIGDFLELERY